MVNKVSSLVQEELDRRGWVQADLARVLCWPAQAVSEVMKAKRRVDASMALDLAEITNRTAEEWLALQAAQDIELAQRDPKAASRLERISRRASLEDVVPMRELLRRGVVDPGDEVSQATQVLELLEVEDLQDDPPYVSEVSAKRTTPWTALTRTQKAWIALARRRARAIDARPYDESGFRTFAERLPRELHVPDDFLALPRRFADVGVRLVHIPAFPGGRIDGVSLTLDDAPMIALSGRGKRIDRVLFTLLHECAHVVSGHWNSGVVRVHEAAAVGDPRTEEAVNRLAESWIFPAGLHLPGSLTGADIDAIAADNGVSRAMVIGQLQHAKIIPWASLVSRGLPTVEEALVSWS